MANVLLFGGFVQVLTAAYSLKQNGHKVFVAVEKDAVAKKSRFTDGYIEFSKDDDNIAGRIIGICKEYAIDIIIPLEDDYASLLSKYKDEIQLGANAKCAVMEWEGFQKVSDKNSLLSICKQNGIGHPHTELISEDYEGVAAAVGFPALIKPNHSEGSKGIMLVNSLEELKAKAPDIISKYGECTLQEYIENDHYYNLMIYRTRDGRFSNYTIIKILRFYPIKGGSSSLAVAVEDKNMLDMCKRLLDILEWEGMADFDILEKGEGDYKIIEINPRVPASLRGAEMSGVNFPEIIVSDVLCGELPVYEYETGNYLRFLGLDMAWFVASPDRFKCKPSWFKFFGKNIFYEDGGRRDFPAMITYIWSGIRKQLSPEFRKSKEGLN